MSYIGQTVRLKIDRFTSVGAFLTDEKGFEVLLPNKYLDDNMELEQDVQVFIYNDSEDRPVATTEKPKLQLHEFSFLTAKSITKFGAFLDWGLEKDLLVPFSEQNNKMEEGKEYLIYLDLDTQTNRLFGSAKVNRYFSQQTNQLTHGEQVKLFVAEKTGLGRKVIVNGKFGGMIFNDRITQPLTKGQIIDGYVEFIRQDGKIDLSLSPVGVEKFDFFTQKVLDYLKANNGQIFLTDKSDSSEINSELGMSKKSFKKALGNLYKRRIINLSDKAVTLKK